MARYDVKYTKVEKARELFNAYVNKKEPLSENAKVLQKQVKSLKKQRVVLIIGLIVLGGLCLLK